jgi:hypothetical protein
MRKIHNVFHVFLFESCKKLAKKKHVSFIYVDDEEQWEIKHILNSRKHYDKLQYYIKWLNWNDIHNEWLNAKSMSNANDLIVDYHEKYSEQISNERIARKRRKTTRWCCKDITLFSFFSRKIFIDFNENAKRQRKACDVYLRRTIKILDHLTTRQNQKHVILLKFFD